MMITDSFLNSCFTLVLNEKTKVRRNLALYRDVTHILDFYDKKEKLDIPVTVQNKYDCLRKICDMKMEGKTTSNIIDSLTIAGEKYKELVDFLIFKTDEAVIDTVIEDNIRQLRIRKKLNSLFSNYDKLTGFLDSIKDGSFDSIDDLVLDYEDIIKELFSKMMEENRGVSIEASSSLDIAKDDFGPVIEMIKSKYERKNTTPTGYPILDNEIFNGGFESSRIYIFAGGSGSGKSTLLNNLIVHSALTEDNNFDMDFTQEQVSVTADENGIKRVYIYITMENTIEESLLRIYQDMFNKTITQALSDVTNGVDLKVVIMEKLKITGSTIIMKYFPAMSISSIDIMGVVDDAINDYGKERIKGLYIDYLDLLKTDLKYDLYRLELGHITISLKTLAVAYNIPVITATQLSRSAYRVEESRNLNLDQMSESIKKVEHADFVALLAKDQVKEGMVHFKVGKNRSGKSDVAIDFTVDFNMFKFIEGVRVTNNDKQDVTTDRNSHLAFSGMNELTKSMENF